MYESQVPIDINCSKIVDWLVQRRHCNRDWGEKLAVIRRKIKAALGDMPENDQIKQLLMDARIDYFKCKKIVDILKQTEADTKNFFGYYSSQRMKDWQEIVNLYERDCVYLAEIATNLIREVNYEVPAVKRLISKLNKDKEDIEKVKINMTKRISQLNAEYNRLAQSYGIKGQDVVRELIEASKDTSSVMDDIITKTKSITKAVDHYRRVATSNSKLDTSQFLATLEYVITNGNTTVYEYEHGEPPLRIESESFDQFEAIVCGSNEAENDDDEIDFGDDLPSSESSSGFVHVDQQADSCAISLSNSDETFVKIDDKVARGDEAKLVLELRRTRGYFVNNLHELEAFLVQILSQEELSVAGQGVMFLDDGDECIHTGKFVFDEKERASALANVRQILGLLSSDKNKLLFQIRESSSTFIDDIKLKFNQTQKQINSCKIRSSECDNQIAEILKQISDTQVHLKKSTNCAKESQEKVELSISQLYSGRPINIMGCV